MGNFCCPSPAQRFLDEPVGGRGGALVYRTGRILCMVVAPQCDVAPQSGGPPPVNVSSGSSGEVVGSVKLIAGDHAVDARAFASLCHATPDAEVFEFYDDRSLFQAAGMPANASRGQDRKDAVVRILEKQGKSIVAEDVFVFFFAGRGRQSHDKGREERDNECYDELDSEPHDEACGVCTKLCFADLPAPSPSRGAAVHTAVEGQNCIEEVLSAAELGGHELAKVLHESFNAEATVLFVTDCCLDMRRNGSDADVEGGCACNVMVSAFRGRQVLQMAASYASQHTRPLPAAPHGASQFTRTLSGSGFVAGLLKATEDIVREGTCEFSAAEVHNRALMRVGKGTHACFEHPACLDPDTVMWPLVPRPGWSAKAAFAGPFDG